jgi:hypothetical protein
VDEPKDLLVLLLILLGCCAGVRLAAGALFAWSLPDLDPKPMTWEE